MRRTRWTGAVLLPLGVVSIATAQVALRAIPTHASTAVAAATDATTQSYATAPTSKSAVEEPGTAAAGANLLGLSPGVSGLTLTTTFGESNAALEHTEAQAKSATVDLGSLGLVLATSTFCGTSAFPTSRQPQPLKADSDTGPTHAAKSTLGPVGQETVTATKSPEQATATTTSISQSLPGIFQVTGNSTAQVSFVPGQGQVATSKVTENLTLLGGQVSFDGMTWQAKRGAGTTSMKRTTFSFGQVRIAGKPMQAPDGAPGKTIAAVNKALAPFGFSFITPSRSSNHHSGGVSIGPLTLRFRGSSIEKTLVSPAVNAVISLENLIAAHSKAGSNCADYQQLLYNVGTNVETLLNVGLAISEGAGVLDLDFGGATASARNATNYTNPFGNGDGPPPPTRTPSTPPPAKDGTTGDGNGPAPSPPSVGHAGNPPPASPPAIGPVTSTVAIGVICRSTSDAGSQHCWRGLATLAGASALAGGVVLLGLDLYFSRRRRPFRRSRYRSV